MVGTHGAADDKHLYCSETCFRTVCPAIPGTLPSRDIVVRMNELALAKRFDERVTYPKRLTLFHGISDRAFDITTLRERSYFTTNLNPSLGAGIAEKVGSYSNDFSPRVYELETIRPLHMLLKSTISPTDTMANDIDGVVHHYPDGQHGEEEMILKDQPLSVLRVVRTYEFEGHMLKQYPGLSLHGDLVGEEEERAKSAALSFRLPLEQDSILPAGLRAGISIEKLRFRSRPFTYSLMRQLWHGQTTRGTSFLVSSLVPYFLARLGPNHHLVEIRVAFDTTVPDKGAAMFSHDTQIIGKGLDVAQHPNFGRTVLAAIAYSVDKDDSTAHGTKFVIYGAGRTGDSKRHKAALIALLDVALHKVPPLSIRGSPMRLPEVQAISTEYEMELHSAFARNYPDSRLHYQGLDYIVFDPLYLLLTEAQPEQDAALALFDKLVAERNNFHVSRPLWNRIIANADRYANLLRRVWTEHLLVQPDYASSRMAEGIIQDLLIDCFTKGKRQISLDVILSLCQHAIRTAGSRVTIQLILEDWRILVMDDGTTMASLKVWLVPFLDRILAFDVRGSSILWGQLLDSEEGSSFDGLLRLHFVKRHLGLHYPPPTVLRSTPDNHYDIQKHCRLLRQHIIVTRFANGKKLGYGQAVPELPESGFTTVPPDDVKLAKILYQVASYTGTIGLDLTMAQLPNRRQLLQQYTVAPKSGDYTKIFNEQIVVGDGGVTERWSEALAFLFDHLAADGTGDYDAISATWAAQKKQQDQAKKEADAMRDIVIKRPADTLTWPGGGQEFYKQLRETEKRAEVRLADPDRKLFDFLNSSKRASMTINMYIWTGVDLRVPANWASLISNIGIAGNYVTYAHAPTGTDIIARLYLDGRITGEMLALLYQQPTFIVNKLMEFLTPEQRRLTVLTRDQVMQQYPNFFDKAFNMVFAQYDEQRNQIYYRPVVELALALTTPPVWPRKGKAKKTTDAEPTPKKKTKKSLIVLS
jgi:hypothetical protein